MAAHRHNSQLKQRLAPAALALACHCAMAQAQAQSQPAQTITVTGRSGTAHTVGVAGFGDMPLHRLPLSATVLTAQQLADAGVASLADITRLDAAVTDAYNAPGYWGQVAVRGFTLDNRYNYRRDGLPINAETLLPTGNKAALELLKGTSGVQAGTSSPGGLLNLVVKRPTAGPLAQAALEWTQPGSATVSADLGGRAGHGAALGWRMNASATHHQPSTRNSQGHARLLAGALSWQATPQALLEVEYEHSLQSQPSTPGFSLLGNTLPSAAAVNPRINLNNQAWSLPVVMQGNTGSLRYTHALGSSGLRVVAHAMQQRLRSDDRIAFPYGCSAENHYDRYCSDGSFDLYDYRSEGERRNTGAADLSLQGSSTLGGLQHHINIGMLATRHTAGFNRQAYNWVGVGALDASAVLPADPTLTDENTQRSERSTEWHASDSVALTPALQLWAGLRHTQLRRSSVRTDGSRATAYTQGLTTPWLALSWQATALHMLYASAGQGMESEVAPNRARYANAGQALPALKSHQFEAGWKHRSQHLQAQLAWFDIRRPQWADLLASSGLPSADCSDAEPCTRRADGQARHRGVEGSAEWQAGPWSLRASAMAQQARRQGSADASTNGLRPTNVPERSIKAQAVYNLAALPGLAFIAMASHEGQRMVLPDNSVATPGWTRLDLALRYAHTAAGHKLVWRLGIDNAADRRAWKEAPYQFGHSYLYPLPPRTWQASVQAAL